MPTLKTKNKPMQPTKTISLSFLAVIIVGAVLLMMPFSSASGKFTSPLTALFTATSATCVTGLVLVDTGTYWNIFGQLVILLMIQIGGLGLVTFTSFFNFMIKKKHELHSMQVASESVNTSGFYDVKSFVKKIVAISFAFELAGAVLLMGAFVPKYGLRGIYISVYLAVTAFCNAGFDVMGAVDAPFASLAGMADDPIVVTVIPMLILAGGLGFFVWQDIFEYRKNKRLTLQSKLVIAATAALAVLGTVIILILEWNNPATLGGKSFLYKLGNSFFCSATLRTAGFNTIDMASLTPFAKMASILLMFIGVAPGSTGGGVKITTISIIVMTIVSVVTNKPDTIIMGRKIEKDLVYKSLSIICIFAFIIIASSIGLCFANPGITGLDSAVEVTSAISTTGISCGVTSVCGIGSRILLILIMFIGRVGPVSFAITLSIKKSRLNKNSVYPEGKLMVG